MSYVGNYVGTSPATYTNGHGAGQAAELPRTTLRAYALAAVAARLPEASEPHPELLYLREHLAAVSPHLAVTDDDATWALTLPDYLLQPDPSDLPLLQLAEMLPLTLLEVLAVALAAAVEDDLLAGRALSRAQAPLGGSRPTLGLLSDVLAATNALAPHSALQTLATGQAVSSGLLTLLNESAPLAERTVSVPTVLCFALQGRDAPRPDAVISTDETTVTPLAASALAAAQQQAAALAAAPRPALLIRTSSRAEGQSAAAHLAQALRCRAVFLNSDATQSLGPWLLLRGLLPVFQYDLGPGERKTLPLIAGYHGPVVALCGLDGSVESPHGAAFTWTLSVPPRAERAALWEQALGAHPLTEELARHHRHGGGRIAHLGRLARHHALLNDREQPLAADLAAAAWTGEGGGLDTLAQPIRDRLDDDALVVTDRLRHELELLLLRCRARDCLTEGLGAAATARYHPGVRALFVGPSGTGKTLAAAWLATQLGLPLYRVDLAAVTSKYIGETEKNLAQLLARAEQAEVVLLFDEADSLFGKRTEINDANDRFANAQTNYLLQRIESFDGITLLTSNSRLRFDEAFARRLDLIVEFPAPGPEERRRLWQAHLGAHHALTQTELNQLAAAADLCGGHIRNVVLAAAVRAQTAERSIEYADLALGLVSEYRKLGRQLPVELRPCS